MGSNGQWLNARVDEASFVNAFLGSDSTTSQFSKIVEQIRKIQRKKKKRLNASQKQEITAHLKFFDVVASRADFDLFRQKIPESELKCWLEFTISEIKRFATTQKWITTGSLETHETYVLSNCISMFNHALPVVLAYESDFFEALGNLVKVRKGNGSDGRPLLPSDDISEWIALIVCNGYYTTISKFDNNWPPDRGFRKLDDFGVLEEFLRCATVPAAVGAGQRFDGLERLVKLTFDELQGCQAVLKKIFKKEDACGKAVRAILEGRDGSKTPRPDIIRIYQEITNFVDSMGRARLDKPNAKLRQMCRKCGKSDVSEEFQKSLMRCARCQNAFYCSKDCQKADWKDHKIVCEPISKSGQKQLDVVNATVNKFVQEQYVDILVKIIQESKETGIAKKDMLVHLDFCVNKDGIVPAMQDPPMFEVAPTARYLDKSFPAEVPEWVTTAKHRAMHMENIEGRISSIKDQYYRLTSRHQLFFMTYRGGHLCSKIECGPLYNDETFEAFSIAFYDGDFTPLMAALDHELGMGFCFSVASKYGLETFPGLGRFMMEQMQMMAMEQLAIDGDEDEDDYEDENDYEDAE